MSTERVAVVGAGVSGLTAAYLLSRRSAVTLFERDDRLGGHAHTHRVRVGDGAAAKAFPVDSGFIVHNDRTYPLLRRLFGELGVEAVPTQMSMSIRDDASGLEFAGGKGLGGFLARPRQLTDRTYLTMLTSVRRFHRVARHFLDTTDEQDTTTFGEFIAAQGFPESFTRLYAVPLVACVWSTGPGDVFDYPAHYLFRFLAHHGMLSIGDSPRWLTVAGGSATYVEAIAARIAHVRKGSPVTAITRHDDGVDITTGTGTDRFDRVVVATHADQALHLLTDATPQEKQVLGAFRYSDNPTVLHRDVSLLPRARRARASWNYLIQSPTAESTRQARPIVTYWMNRLQGHPAEHPLLVTLNARDRIDPELVIASMTYAHPIYDRDSVAASSLLPGLASARCAFAGAYHGWGFHEDGARSGVAAAQRFGAAW